MNGHNLTVEAVTWQEHEREIRSVRQTVFVVEQAVPETIDFDGTDPVCDHALAFIDDQVVATGRIEADGHIGRIAVLKTWRGKGIGRALVQFLAGNAKHKGLNRVYLNSQVSAIGFYEHLGFKKTGKVFMEAGIEHVTMEREDVT